MNDVFFGKEGITSTSANYFANIAKETIQADVKKLENVGFITTTVTSVIGTNTYTIKKGSSNLEWIKESLERISNMNMLCAWLREAIKTKEEMLLELPNFDMWVKKYHPEISMEAPKKPKREDEINSDFILKSWDINKHLKYLELEAKAATFGKYIHPNGSISKARELAHNVINNPTTVDGIGREALIYNKNLTISTEKLDEHFMDWQNVYRTFEKELNYLKAELKEAVNRENEKRLNDYEAALNDFNKDTEQFWSKVANLRKEFDSWLIKQKETISNLKIIIPKDLIPIYEIVVKTSK